MADFDIHGTVPELSMPDLRAAPVCSIHVKHQEQHLLFALV